MTVAAPGGAELLAGQLRVEQESLDVAERLLQDPRIEEGLRKAVEIRFRTLFEQRRAQLAVVRTLLQPADGDLGPAWTFLREARKNDLRLLREYLAFLEGALLRGAGMDGGACELADRLLAELAGRTEIPWSRLTILAEGELVELSTRIIRLRFPQVGIWRLPLMAHEFGHLVVSELEAPDPGGLTSTKPLEAFVEAIPGQRLKLRELCSDIFAVHALGPAFACNAILLEFDPSAVDDEPDEAKHPSDGKRAYTVLQALRRLDDEKDRYNKPFANLAAGLDELWRAGRADAGKPAELASATQGQLDFWLELVWGHLRTWLPKGVVYDRRAWGRAQRLAPALAAGDAASALQKEDGLVDVLNAAWSARLSATDAGGDLGVRAAALTRAVMARGGR